MQPAAILCLAPPPPCFSSVLCTSTCVNVTQRKPDARHLWGLEKLSTFFFECLSVCESSRSAIRQQINFHMFLSMRVVLLQRRARRFCRAPGSDVGGGDECARVPPCPSVFVILTASTELKTLIKHGIPTNPSDTFRDYNNQ